MSVSNSTTLNDLVGQIVSEEAISAAYSTRVMRPLIRNVQVPQGAGSVVVPVFSGVIEASLTEGTAPSSTAMNTTGVTLTPVERGVYVQISKRVLHADPFNDIAPYGEQIGRALAQGEDKEILATMAEDFSTIDIGSTATDTNLSGFRAAIATLEAQNAPKPYYAVYHPVSWSKLVSELDDASAFSAVGKQIVEGFGEGMPSLNGYVAAPYGVPTFISTQVPDSANTSGYANVMFSKDALALAWIKDIGVDVDDNITARAFDLMGWRSADQKILVDTYGVTVLDKK